MRHSAYLSKLLPKTQNRDQNIFMLSLAIAILKKLLNYSKIKINTNFIIYQLDSIKNHSVKLENWLLF